MLKEYKVKVCDWVRMFVWYVHYHLPRCVCECVRYAKLMVKSKVQVGGGKWIVSCGAFTGDDSREKVFDDSGV